MNDEKRKYETFLKLNKKTNNPFTMNVKLLLVLPLPQVLAMITNIH